MSAERCTGSQKKQGSPILILLTAVVCLFVSACAAPSRGVTTAPVQAGVVAMVGPRAVSNERLERVHRYHTLTSKARDPNVRGQILRTLVELEMLRLLAADEGITYTDADLVRDVLASQGPDQKTSPGADTLARHRDSPLALQLERRALLVGLLERRGLANLAPAGLKQYYTTHLDEFSGEESVQIGTLVVSNTHDEPSRQLAAKLLALAKAGVPFVRLEAQYSIVPPAYRGNKDWIPRGTLRPDVESTLFSMQPGDVALLDTGGLRLVKCYQRRAAGPVPFEEIEHVVGQSVIEEAIKEHLPLLLSEGRRKYEVRLP